ncbi:IST3 [Mytilus edulis]|uniref:RNA-binding motif protein, X-linked 2 n=1 Tax=Mytilus edulis TaxID=6550 RepID=A0A8S3T746_MYTED|nr:IST3 [Mytilus edulis]
MNPLTNVKNLQKINEKELELGLVGKKSWHDKYKESAWIFVGGLPYDLTEGDVICVFSQYGEIVNINIVRDKKTGKIKGYGFLCYEDQRSTVLAVDNLNGAKVLGRTLRVDHVENYKQPKEFGDEDDITKQMRSEGCAPQLPQSDNSEKEEDSFVVPMKKVKKEKKPKKKKKEKKKKHKNQNLQVTEHNRGPQKYPSDRDSKKSNRDFETHENRYNNRYESKDKYHTDFQNGSNRNNQGRYSENDSNYNNKQSYNREDNSRNYRRDRKKKPKKKEKEKKKKHKKSESSSDSDNEVEPVKVKKEKHDIDDEKSYNKEHNRGPQKYPSDRDSKKSNRDFETHENRYNNRYESKDKYHTDFQNGSNRNNQGRYSENDSNYNNKQSYNRGDNSRNYRRDRSRSPNNRSLNKGRDRNNSPPRRPKRDISNSPPRRRERSRDISNSPPRRGERARDRSNSSPRRQGRSRDISNSPPRRRERSRDR